jgi:transcriptional regulator with XRE-family HTH domain
MFQKQTFTNNLRAARKRAGLSQQALARALYISTQAVSKWERGEAVPDLTHVCRLAEILQISVDELLDVRRSEEALIAVDGGGTKTEFVLISLSGRLLKRLVLPGSNPNSVTVAGATDILCRGIDNLQREGRRILGIFVGGAGFYSGKNGASVEESLQKVYPGIKIRCESDICNVLACAEDPKNAIAVICGTGSVVYATQKGKLLRCGGGGWRLETLGSG